MNRFILKQVDQKTTELENSINRGKRRARRMKKRLIPLTPIICGLLFAIFTVSGVNSLNRFFSGYEFYFRSPIKINVQKPYVFNKKKTIEKKEDRVILTPIPTKVITPTPTKAIKRSTAMTDRDIVEYIKSKAWDSEIAIRLAKSENFWNLTKSFDCARVGAQNSNGSYDYGLFQINSIHERTLAKLGMTLEDMKDCKKNIDFAFGYVYSGAGWGAWSAYNNGSYLAHDLTVY